MNVGTRITVASAVVVMIATSIYAVFDLRSRVTERRTTVEREARAVASTLRATFELSGSAFRAPSAAQLEVMSVRTGGWHIAVLPRESALEPTPGPDESAAQLKRLQTITEIPTLCEPRRDGTTSSGVCAGVEGTKYFYALPLRAAQSSADAPLTFSACSRSVARPRSCRSRGDDLVGASRSSR